MDVGQGQHRRQGGLHTHQRAVHVAAVGRRTVRGHIVAGTAVVEREDIDARLVLGAQDTVQAVVDVRPVTLAHHTVEGIGLERGLDPALVRDRTQRAARGVRVRVVPVRREPVARVVRVRVTTHPRAVARGVVAVDLRRRLVVPGRQPVGPVVGVRVRGRPRHTGRRLRRQVVVVVPAVRGGGQHLAGGRGQLVTGQPLQRVVGEGPSGLAGAVVDLRDLAGDVVAVGHRGAGRPVVDRLQPARGVVPEGRRARRVLPRCHRPVAVVGERRGARRTGRRQQQTPVVVGEGVQIRAHPRDSRDAVVGVVGVGVVDRFGLRALAGLPGEPTLGVVLVGDGDTARGALLLHPSARVVDRGEGAVRQLRMLRRGRLDRRLGQPPGVVGGDERVAAAVREARTVARRVVAEGRGDRLGRRDRLDRLGHQARRVDDRRAACTCRSCGCPAGRPRPCFGVSGFDAGPARTSGTAVRQRARNRSGAFVGLPPEGSFWPGQVDRTFFIAVFSAAVTHSSYFFFTATCAATYVHR